MIHLRMLFMPHHMDSFFFLSLSLPLPPFSISMENTHISPFIEDSAFYLQCKAMDDLFSEVIPRLTGVTRADLLRVDPRYLMELHAEINQEINEGMAEIFKIGPYGRALTLEGQRARVLLREALIVIRRISAQERLRRAMDEVVQTVSSFPPTSSSQLPHTPSTAERDYLRERSVSVPCVSTDFQASKEKEEEIKKRCEILVDASIHAFHVDITRPVPFDVALKCLRRSMKEIIRML
jgi:hypothetical protein